MTRTGDRLIIAGCMAGNRTESARIHGMIWISEGIANSYLVVEEIPASGGVVKKLPASETRRPD